jgi:hypothetical protein
MIPSTGSSQVLISDASATQLDSQVLLPLLRMIETLRSFPVNPAEKEKPMLERILYGRL